jgi:hypothetical protein
MSIAAFAYSVRTTGINQQNPSDKFTMTAGEKNRIIERREAPDKPAGVSTAGLPG